MEGILDVGEKVVAARLVVLAVQGHHVECVFAGDDVGIDIGVGEREREQPFCRCNND